MAPAIQVDRRQRRFETLFWTSRWLARCGVALSFYKKQKKRERETVAWGVAMAQGAS
jgi:hypothetical protein